MRIAFLGNFGVSFCTEVHLSKSFESLGHEVTRIQEGETKAVDVPNLVQGHDLWVWTQTYGLAETGGTREERVEMIERIRKMGVPSLGIHLDRWWGLRRERQVYEEPYFTLDTLATADGGHQKQWEELGVRHIWFPPGVFHEEAEPGIPRPEYESEIAFVGGWRGYGHTEWRHRRQLVHHLRIRYGRRIAFWPKVGQPAVRERNLQDLYASAKIAIGDSCLVPTKHRKPMTHYCSDRIPETVGRGCLLLHPHVEGVTDGTLYTPDEHLVTWPLGNFRAMDQQIERMLTDDEERKRIAKAGHAHVLENHTYKVRLAQLLEQL